MSSENQLQAQRWRIASDPTNYLYDGYDDTEEVDGAGSALTSYARNASVDEPLSEFHSGTASYYEQDALGSVTSLSSLSGALANSYSYDSFGNLTTSSETMANQFQYTARKFDKETGIYYYRARYYSQNIGRFNSGDPMRFTAGVNFYAYTWNNPANYSDPFGLCPPRVPNHITCDTLLPNGQTIGDWIQQLSDALNQVPQNTPPTSTPYGPSPNPNMSPDLIAHQVYDSTNFRAMFGGPGANYALLGDLGNFAYGAVSANIGVPLLDRGNGSRGILFAQTSTERLGLALGNGPKRTSAGSSGVQCKMQKVTIFFVGLLLLCVLSCGKLTEEHLTEVKNGTYKVYVRSQEFDNSGIRNVDICVADVTSSRFPVDTRQCFLHGFDFSGLTVRWLSEDNVEISFSCGRVTMFSNFAVISKNRPVPVEFHATLNDKCNATPNRASVP